MAAFIDEVATYLEAQGIGSWSGTDAARTIFTSEQPSQPDNCVTIFGLQGDDPGQSKTVSSLHFHRLQVVVRNTNYDTCQTKLAAVRAALHGKYTLVFANWRVLRSHIDYEGTPTGPDEQGRHEAFITFHTESNAETPAP